MLSSVTIAQKTAKKKFEYLPNKIYLKSGCCFVLNNNTINKKNLGNYLQDNPQTFSLYTQGIKQRKMSDFLGFLSLISITVARLVVDKNTNLSVGLLGVSFGSIIPAFILQTKGNKKISKALCAYNSTH